MQDLLVLWDAIFADGVSFDLVDYIFVAMLMFLRDTCKLLSVRKVGIYLILERLDVFDCFIC